MLELRHLTKSYGGPAGRAVLSGISLTVAPGEYVAITGESGVGKSTLLNLIAGLDVPDAGSVLLDGEDLARLDDADRTRLRRRRMGFVFQAFHLLPHLTVAQNVALPLALLGTPPSGRGPAVDELLGAVGMGNRAGSLPRELSGGEMQRVAIARALIHRPSLVLADEPTGNLDPDNARQVLMLLRERIHAARGIGILVTHSMAAAATADRVFELTGAGLVPRTAG